jgi:drug/metabolite transporter (DMT)-like permease
VTLRFGVGALLFMPYLLLHLRTIGRDAWLRGMPLALFQGAGMGALVICGLQFAPANHQAVLGPGIVPALVALVGFLFFARRPSSRVVAGAVICAIGALALIGASGSARAGTALTGDVMFLAASILGAFYALQMRNWGLGAMQAAAMVMVYSGMVVVPWYLWSASTSMWRAAPVELIWQILWQGVLIGGIALVALNHAISRLGPERSTALVALVPVLSAILAFLFLGEVPSAAEIVAILAISAGVSIGASRGYAGSPAASNAPMKRAA